MLNPDSRLEALLSVPVLHGPQASPTAAGSHGAGRGSVPAADVFAAPTDGSALPIRLTETADDTLVASWTPDSRAVVVGQTGTGTSVRGSSGSGSRSRAL